MRIEGVVPVLLLLTGCISACATDRLNAPRPGQVSPEVLRLIEQANLPTGPVAVAVVPKEGGGTELRLPIGAYAAQGMARPSVSADITAGSADAPEAQLLFIVAPAGPKTNGAQNTFALGWKFYCTVLHADGSRTTYQSLSSTVNLLGDENVEGTGGHLFNHSGFKPHGAWQPSAGDTRSDGVFVSTFTSKVASGDERVGVVYTVHDTPCAGTTADQQYVLGVRIRGLVRVAPMTNLVISPISSDHSDIYYATPAARDGAYRLATYYTRLAQGSDYVRLNAISLPFGGINDIGSNWQPPHNTHRTGTDVDVDGQSDAAIVHLRLIAAGQRAGARKCERHGPVSAPNHVHCYFGPVYTD